MKLVFNKNDGIIQAVLENWQNREVYFHHYSEEFKDNLDEIQVEKLPKNLERYKIMNNRLIEMADKEIQEIQMYGRILTEEERLLQKLKPSPEEVKKKQKILLKY